MIVKILKLFNFYLSNEKIDVSILNIIIFKDDDLQHEITALYIAYLAKNIEIIKLFLNNEKTDVNILNIID